MAFVSFAQLLVDKKVRWVRTVFPIGLAILSSKCWEQAGLQMPGIVLEREPGGVVI